MIAMAVDFPYLPPITPEYIKTILDYNPDTGIFIWKENPTYPPEWNTKYANKRAGCARPIGNGVLYRFIGIRKKQYFEQVLAWAYMTGAWPVLTIDHKNKDQLDNKWDNLRLATRSQNQMNRGLQSNNTSGYKGVVWHKIIKKWVARIKIDNKTKHLGCFTSPEEAFVAYCEAAKVLHGEFASLDRVL